MSLKREQTRARILQAAWQLFHERGYQDTSTRAIARAAGVADGTVFSHFETKLEILKAGIIVRIEDVIEQADRRLSASTPAQRLLHYAEYLYPFYAENAEFSRELFKELLWQQDDLRPQIEAFIRKLFPKPPAERDLLYGHILMDCYFMTLLEGLGDTEYSASRMLDRLERKLAYFGSEDGAD
ncbi:TetR/AcrR family transcriptional regulator [Marinobacterium sp. AK62]|uniref:TetR/AcrR family transcriptional regulator n=1 Tax=Marinobacterium alkalitolerans TaxID=1542925 RepID=A0ABS3Z9C4_9GAMM|nr:TetR/AcrR family transcriptional regulator [Marinobacterium alkalitolerans]MBP0048294.1 TetR/AcrR family transcriptional regulator [Marinobacterium alkalitolerans]